MTSDFYTTFNLIGNALYAFHVRKTYTLLRLKRSFGPKTELHAKIFGYSITQYIRHTESKSIPPSLGVITESSGVFKPEATLSLIHI